MGSPIPADTRFGRYEIRVKLGEGGMGEVYLLTVMLRYIARPVHSAGGCQQ